MEYRAFYRGVAYVLLITFSTYTFAAPLNNTTAAARDTAASVAAPSPPDFKELGQEAKTLGTHQAHSLSKQADSVKDGVMSVPVLKNGQFEAGNTTVYVDDLFPGTRRDNPDAANTYFPDGKKPDLDELKNVYNLDKAMGQAGETTKKGLWKETQQAHPSIAGSAYQVVLDASRRTRPDFSNDPLLNQSKHTYQKIDKISKWFGDCSTDTTYERKERTAHIPDYQRCTQLYKPAGGCVIQHTIEIDTEPTDMVFLVDNSASMDYAINDLRNNVRTFANLIMQGKARNLRLGGAAFRDWDYGWHNVPLSDNINQFQNWINGVVTAPAPTRPFAVVKWAAEHYEWRDNVHRVIVLIGNDDYGCGFYPGIGGCPSRDEVINALNSRGITLYLFHNNPEVESIGNHLADYFSGPRLLKFAQFFTVVTDHWSPQSCINDAIASLEEFCQGTYTPTPATDNTCVNLSGFDVCKDDPIYQKLKPPPIPNVPKLAAKVDVSALRCDYNHGEGTCWTDAQGKKQCLRNDKDIDQCQPLEANPKCGFVSAQCVEGAKGSWGNCYVWERTYDCGEDIKVPTIDKSTQYRCAGPVRCMGEDCLGIDRSQSTDFAKAAALLNAAQFMTQDMDCKDVTNNNNLYCRAFAGKGNECKVAVGGVQNCCKNPTNLSMNDYLTLILSVPKLDGAMMSIGDGSTLAGVKGAYQLLRSPALNGWTQVTKPFVTYLENMTGAFNNFVQPVTDVAKQALSALKDEVTKMTSKVLTNASTTGAAGVPAGAPQSMTQQLLGQQGAAMLSTAMTVYTAYVVTMVMIQVIWKCKKEEFEMNAKRQLKNCTHLGSYCKSKILGMCIEKREAYCCFNSPLSRIIQEQVRPQLGLSWGSVKQPLCDGIPVDRLIEVNWDKVNLDEWIGLLQQNGHFPNPERLTPDALTGAGHPFNTDGQRKNIVDRSTERLKGVEVDKLRDQATKLIKPDTGSH